MADPYNDITTKYGRMSESNGKMRLADDSIIDLVNPISKAINISEKNYMGEIVDLFLTDTQAVDLVLEQCTFGYDVVDAYSPSYTPVANDCLTIISEGRIFQARIISVLPEGGDVYQLSLSSLFDYTFPAGTAATIGKKKAIVDGSTTPIIFDFNTYGLGLGYAFEVTSIHWQVSYSGTTAVNGNYGNISSLPKGILFRWMYNDETYRQLRFVRNHGNFLGSGWDLRYYNLSNSVQAHADLKKVYGSTILLSPGSSRITSGRFDFIVQDNLTLLSTGNVSLIGFIRNVEY